MTGVRDRQVVSLGLCRYRVGTAFGFRAVSVGLSTDEEQKKKREGSRAPQPATCCMQMPFIAAFAGTKSNTMPLKVPDEKKEKKKT